MPFKGDWNTKDRATVNAIASYEEAMTVVATQMDQLAWDHLQQGRTESALPLARQGQSSDRCLDRRGR
jgi:hypothetical protein